MSNAGVPSYFNVWFDLILRLALRRDAPKALKEADLTVLNYEDNIMKFIQGEWWSYWQGSLPAMMRDLLPCGMDGSGNWWELMMDAHFNTSCRNSMSAAWTSNTETRVSLLEYARAVEKTSK